MVGQAFSLNGIDAYVQAPANPAQDPTSAGSQDAWVMFNQLPSSAGHTMEIIGKGGGGTDFDLQAETDNRIRFYIAGGSNVGSTTVIQTGVWYHIAGTWDATGLRMYVNGVLENTNGILNLTRGQSNNPLQIGNQPTFGPRLFNGLIDEAEIFDRALTQAEIKAIVNAGSAGKCRTCTPTPPNMVAWLPGNGDANDISGNGNNGILRGDANFVPGMVAQAFNLDGNGDYVEIPESPSLQSISAAITLDAWIRTPGKFTCVGYSRILTKIAPSPFRGFNLDLVNNGSTVRMEVFNAAGGGVNAFSDVQVNDN